MDDVPRGLINDMKGTARKRKDMTALRNLCAYTIQRFVRKVTTHTRAKKSAGKVPKTMKITYRKAGTVSYVTKWV